MSKPKSAIAVEPLLLTKEQVAKLLGRGASQFDKVLPALTVAGFPQPDPILGGWYIRAIRQWLDHRYSLHKTLEESDEDLFLRNAEDLDGDDQGVIPSH